MYHPEHVKTKEVKVDEKEYPSADIYLLRSHLSRKFARLLQQLEKEDRKSVVETIQQAKEIFVNEYLYNIALYIAQNSENEQGVTSEQIAEHLQVKEVKYVHNKFPFIRNMLEMIGLKLISYYIENEKNEGEDEKENSFKRSKKLKIPYHKIELI